MNQPPLKFLHAEGSLIELKLEYFRRISTEDLLESLKPEKMGALKTKADGTIMDGHHRITILRERGVDVEKLPREIWERIK
jgi:hypothetical protein